jgi:hypothetical protein
LNNNSKRSTKKKRKSNRRRLMVKSTSKRKSLDRSKSSLTYRGRWKQNRPNSNRRRVRPLIRAKTRKIMSNS